MRGEPQPKIYAASGIANREGNAELSSDPGSGRKRRFRFCDDPLASSMPPQAPPQRRTGSAPGPWLRTRTGCTGTRETPPYTHPRSCGNVRGRVAQSCQRGGDRTHTGWPGCSRSVTGVIDGGRGHRWRPLSGHRASGSLGHLPQSAAWIRKLRAARQGHGAVGAPDLSCSAAGARPPEPQPQREPRAGAGGGSATAAAAAREAPAPQAARASVDAAPADTCRPGRRPIRGARSGGECRAPGGRGTRAHARAGAGGAFLAGFSGPPPRAQAAGAGGAGRGAAGGGAGAERARDRDPRPALGSTLRRSAVSRPRPRGSQMSPQVITSFEVRVFLPCTCAPGARTLPDSRMPGNPNPGPAWFPECGRPPSLASPKPACLQRQLFLTS